MATWSPTELERYFTLLKLLEREPNWKTSRQLADLLAEREIPTALRSVQRILEYFHNHDEFRLRRRGKGTAREPYQWAWARKGVAIPFPTMDPAAALTYQLAADLLAPLLPAAFLDELDPQFKRARHVLGQTSKQTAALAGKLRILPRGSGRLPAKICNKVLRAVEAALLEDKQLLARARWNGPMDMESHAQVSPLALVFRFDTMYLVFAVEDRGRIGTHWVALHRVSGAKVLDEPVVRPPDFDLDEMLWNVRYHRLPGRLRFGPLGKMEPFRLRARVTREETVALLRERPFSDDQTLAHSKDGWQLDASVVLTGDLLAELRDLGADIEVLEPSPLRDYLACQAEALSDYYERQSEPRRIPSRTAPPLRAPQRESVALSRQTRDD